eukprot:1143110-Pelagomonas_calceolata.AAC.3
MAASARQCIIVIIIIIIVVVVDVVNVVVVCLESVLAAVHTHVGMQACIEPSWVIALKSSGSSSVLPYQAHDSACVH